MPALFTDPRRRLRECFADVPNLLQNALPAGVPFTALRVEITCTGLLATPASK